MSQRSGECSALPSQAKVFAVLKKEKKTKKRMCDLPVTREELLAKITLVFKPKLGSSNCSLISEKQFIC